MKFFKRISCVFFVLLLVLSCTTGAFAASAPTCQVQWASQWKNYTYGSYGNQMTLYDSGCGIFAFSNAVYYLTGNKPSITEVAQWAADGGYLNGYYGGGSIRDIYNAAYEEYGERFGFVLDGEGSGWSNDLIKHLQSGGVAIGNVPGHYIAIVGYDASTQKFHIYDSAPGLLDATATNGGDVWLTASQLTTGSSAYGVQYNLNWYTKLRRTGVTPEWSGGGVNLGDSFYAFFSNTYNEQTLYFTSSPDSNAVAGKELDNTLSQVWEFTRQSDGSYEIASMLDGRLLTIEGGATVNGTVVNLAQDTNASYQKWHLATYDGGYRLTPAISGYIGLDYDTAYDKAQVWKQSVGDPQVFNITKVTIGPDDLGEDFYATISNNDQSVLYLTGTTNGNKVEGKAMDNSPEQIWHFTRQNDGTYEIANALNGRLLSMASSTANSGTAVNLAADTDAQNQKWTVYILGDEYKIFPALSNDVALDCDVNAKLLTKSASASQYLSITKVSAPVIEDNKDQTDSSTATDVSSSTEPTDPSEPAGSTSDITNMTEPAESSTPTVSISNPATSSANTPPSGSGCQSSTEAISAIAIVAMVSFFALIRPKKKKENKNG